MIKYIIEKQENINYIYINNKYYLKDNSEKK